VIPRLFGRAARILEPPLFLPFVSLSCLPFVVDATSLPIAEPITRAADSRVEELTGSAAALACRFLELGVDRRMAQASTPRNSALTFPISPAALFTRCAIDLPLSTASLVFSTIVERTSTPLIGAKITPSPKSDSQSSHKATHE